jgi:hypothetical protein
MREAKLVGVCSRDVLLHRRESKASVSSQGWPPRRVRGARAGKHARALAVLRGGPERQNKKVRELPTVGRGNFCKIQIPAQTLSIWLAQVIRRDSTWSEQSRSSRSSSRRRSSPRFVWPADPHPSSPASKTNSIADGAKLGGDQNSREEEIRFRAQGPRPGLDAC